jgi:hypothetical protein
MVIYITAVRMGTGGTGGTGVEHIAAVWWLDPTAGQSKTMTTQQAVEWLDVGGNTARVGGPDGPIAVEVVRPAGRAAYLRTKPDATQVDNLLALPRY